MEYNKLATTEKPKRSDLLSVFCVLSFIGSGLSFITYLYITFAYTMVKDMVLYEQVYDSFPDLKDMVLQFLEPGRIFFLCNALLFAASLVGVSLLWKLNTKGFHVYALSQILLLMMPFLGGFGSFSLSPTIWTALFIGVYALEIRKIIQREKAIKLSDKDDKSEDSEQE